MDRIHRADTLTAFSHLNHKIKPQLSPLRPPVLFSGYRRSPSHLSHPKQIPTFAVPALSTPHYGIRAHFHSSALNASPSSSIATAAPGGLSSQAIFYMFLLALQFGTQPGLTKRFTPKSVCRSTVVMGQEVFKLSIALIILVASGNWASAVSGWTISTWLAVAGIPAALYCVQNYATLMAYQNLDPLTFNVLNQTKTLSAALCCFLIMGRRQSRLQVVSLFFFFFSAIVIEKIVPLDSLFSFAKREKQSSSSSIKNEGHKEPTADEDEQNDGSPLKPKKSSATTHFTQGVIPVLLASFISGLAGALAQKNLQSASGCGISGGRNSYLFTAELSLASLFFLCFSIFGNRNDREQIVSNGFFHNWTPGTLIPIVTNAAGGIIVGLVTKYAGSVKKGFALIFGLLLSGVLQATITSKNIEEGEKKRGVSKEQVVGAVLASISLWMHSSFPYVSVS